MEKVTGYHFDISANAESGLNSAKLMEKFIETSGYGEAITALVLVIKQFLAQRYMNEVYSGGLGSYSVFILVTNFIMVIIIFWHYYVFTNIIYIHTYINFIYTFFLCILFIIEF